MAVPLLQTKLHVPRTRHALVPRPRLIARLGGPGESALTLVSAPAGFGKTTLLTEWLATAPADGWAVAWLSLDPRDNDPALFWTYVVAALDTAAEGVGAGARSLLDAGQATETVLATLINDLHAVAHDVALVLDDYHVIDSPQVNDAMGFLVEHMPPQLHLVIAGRADPALPLARLRGRGELAEIRAADLRFTPDEAAEYLNEKMGLTLTARDVEALEQRTEGWVAALQLAALSMRGRDDVAAFIASFGGDDRYVVDYLVEEVLQRQPDDVRSFLLRTSVLSRVTGSLCDAVTGQDGGTAMLAALERANLFLVPLDDHRRWYRYHHLFADVLHARLLAEQPDAAPGLHRRASDWYEEHGERPEAIHHAMAGEDFERAADLVELAMPALRQQRQEATLRRWLEGLPEEVLRARPELSLSHAGTLLMYGELDGVETRLRDAERWVDARVEGHDRRDAAPVGEDPLIRKVRSEVAVYRAAQARLHGDVAGTVTHARRVLDLVGEDAPLERGAAAGLLGLAYWMTGDLAPAHRSWAEAVANLERAGHFADTLGCTIALADIRTAQGRLHDAVVHLEHGLRVATAHGTSVLRGAADMHVGLSGVLRERNELDGARQHLATSEELGEHAGLPQNRHRWRLAMARIREAEGDLDGALQLLDDAERVYTADMFPDVRPLAAWRARVLLERGELGEALAWVRARGLAVDDDLSYLREFEHLTLARVLLARSASVGEERSLRAATELLERLLRAAQEGERTGSVIEILVLQARAHRSGGDLPAATAALRRAVTLAEPEGYVRVFADEGPSLDAVLRVLEKEGPARSFVRRLLAATSTTADAALADPGLIEPLSDRELDVLRLLGTELNGPDIARHLIVSLNTVRTHTKNIYAKLGVNSRRAAVRRAGELGLL
ncbi:helix-turn-helix transcriptional regulator [Georgenia yuyongxinii]|uniref:Helix-turn-helix transcriptional regulator n=1 Tax=Georgenia yuyongxinii TaxID=2589797 RepID=A0A5B8C666_9MICO|nr:LuxR C-terminal-related transcriptional regulator [Georgenia yuyongxinii]QDC23476.1 helix-turn-helix transcriptional regulator [Georgenia yuyongxinii]